MSEDLNTKSLGEKLFEAFGNDGWAGRSADNQAMYERYALAFAALLSHDETANAVITDLRQRLQAAEERAEKVEGALKYATGALKALRPVLTVPAAEYVPAIPDAWAIIDDAIAEIENGR